LGTSKLAVGEIGVEPKKRKINNMTTYEQAYTELCELFGVDSDETLAINPPYLVD